MNQREAIQIILKHEGGSKYTFDKDDRGGETKYGISKRSYPNLDIKNLTEEKAISIYDNDYWLRNHVDAYPPYLRLMMFDMFVNLGSKGAATVLQRAINQMKFVTVTVDGIAGVATRNAASICRGELRHYITYQRVIYYQNIVIRDNSQIKYLKGWMNRTMDILSKSF